MPEKISKQEYFDMCAGHDWYYNFSDDQRVWRAGNAYEKNLRDIASNYGSEYANIYNAWSEFYFSGPSFGNEKAPKPVRPE